MLGATRCSLFYGVAHAHRGDPVGLWWRSFLSSFFSISFIGKHTWTLKKQLCHLICNLIDFGSSSFNYCLFRFLYLLKFRFFLISSLNILFDLRIQLLKSLQATTYYLNPYYNYNFNFKVRLYQYLKRMVSDIGERCKIDLKLELFRDAKGMYEKKITYDCIVYFYPSSLHCTFSYYVKNIFFTTLFFSRRKWLNTFQFRKSGSLQLF